MHSRMRVRAAAPLLLAALSMLGARSALAQRDRLTIPAETLVRVRLDQPISSRTARVADRLTATLAPTDTSGFPVATQFEGEVTEVQRYTADRPGILDMDFHRALL